MEIPKPKYKLGETVVIEVSGILKKPIVCQMTISEAFYDEVQEKWFYTAESELSGGIKTKNLTEDHITSLE